MKYTFICCFVRYIFTFPLLCWCWYPNITLLIFEHKYIYFQKSVVNATYLVCSTSLHICRIYVESSSEHKLALFRITIESVHSFTHFIQFESASDFPEKMSIVQIEILTLPPESIHFLQLPGNGKQQGHLWPPLSLHQWPMAQISATTTVVLKDTYPWFYNTFYRNALRGPNENVYHCFAPLVNFTFHLFIKLTFHLFIKVPGKNVSFNSTLFLALFIFS